MGSPQRRWEWGAVVQSNFATRFYTILNWMLVTHVSLSSLVVVCKLVQPSRQQRYQTSSPQVLHLQIYAKGFEVWYKPGCLLH